MEKKKENIEDHGGKHCLTCKGFTNEKMIDHKLWCKIHKERRPAGWCPQYDLNTEEYFEGKIRKVYTSIVKGIEIHTLKDPQNDLYHQLFKNGEKKEKKKIPKLAEGGFITDPDLQRKSGLDQKDHGCLMRMPKGGIIKKGTKFGNSENGLEAVIPFNELLLPKMEWPYQIIKTPTKNEKAIIYMKKYCLNHIMTYRHEMSCWSHRPDWMRRILIIIWLEQYFLVEKRFGQEIIKKEGDFE